MQHPSNNNSAALYWMTAGVLIVLAVIFLWNALILTWAFNRALAIALGAVLAICTQILVTTKR